MLKFENLFIMRHLWRNSNTRRQCSKLGRNELNVKAVAIDTPVDLEIWKLMNMPPVT